MPYCAPSITPSADGPEKPMRLTRAGEYAVRCMLYLASLGTGELAMRKEIARVMGIPEQFLGKIAQQLSRAGFIDIVQGAKGGYRLVVPPQKLTLLDVVEAVEAEQDEVECGVGERLEAAGVARHVERRPSPAPGPTDADPPRESRAARHPRGARRVSPRPRPPSPGGPTGPRPARDRPPGVWPKRPLNGRLPRLHESSHERVYPVESHPVRRPHHCLHALNRPRTEHDNASYGE